MISFCMCTRLLMKRLLTVGGEFLVSNEDWWQHICPGEYDRWAPQSLFTTAGECVESVSPGGPRSSVTRLYLLFNSLKPKHGSSDVVRTVWSMKQSLSQGWFSFDKHCEPAAQWSRMCWAICVTVVTKFVLRKAQIVLINCTALC